MMNLDSNALLCDLAETYNIYDIRSLPITTVATFSVGLRENSRIKMKMSGMDVSLDIQLLASAVDRLSLLVWQRTKDGATGKNVPKSIYDALTNKEDKLATFTSPEDFRRMRDEIIERSKNG